MLSWIDSGAELCSLKKPDTPPLHLVSYFVVVDQDHILLVDHIIAQLWLPTGGHVEPEEDPIFAVRREAKEELSIEAEFLRSGPLFLTEAQTVECAHWPISDGQAGQQSVQFSYNVKAESC